MPVKADKNIFDLVEKNIGVEALSVLCKTVSLAESAGMKVFLVGGTVRDIIMGREYRDIDIAVEGDAVKIGRALVNSMSADIKLYEKFGTCTISFDGKVNSSVAMSDMKVDMATAREETYSFPGAFPDIKPSSIMADLSRRDFTVNAMAVNMSGKSRGVLIDPYGGETDVKDKIIRVLHDNSFIDDPARIFRAVRFETRLAFNIEEHTRVLIKDALQNGMIRAMRENRIKEEWVLVEKEKNRKKCFSRLRDLLGDDMKFITKIVEKKKGEENGKD